MVRPTSGFAFADGVGVLCLGDVDGAGVLAVVVAGRVVAALGLGAGVTTSDGAGVPGAGVVAAGTAVQPHSAVSARVTTSRRTGSA